MIADALVFLMKRFSGDMQMNIGWGREISIRQLAETIGRIVGFEGKLVFAASKPDGTPRKLLDTTRLSGLGWKATTSLEEGLEKSYSWFLENVA